MKYLKNMAVAVVAAAALMSLAGAGTASADELCTTTAVGNMCPAGNEITQIEASDITTTRFKTTGGTTLATCTSTSLTWFGLFMGTGISPISTGSLTSSFAGCSTLVTTVFGGTGMLSSGFFGGTTVTSSGAEWTLELFGISCTYGTGFGTDLGEITTSGEWGPFNKTLNKRAGGALCPSTIKLEAGFRMTNHTAIHYITN